MNQWFLEYKIVMQAQLEVDIVRNTVKLIASKPEDCQNMSYPTLIYPTR